MIDLKRLIQAAVVAAGTLLVWGSCSGASWQVELTASYDTIYEEARFEKYNDFQLRLVGTGGVSVDWGDGSVERLELKIELKTEPGERGTTLSHRYRAFGSYPVRIVGQDGTLVELDLCTERKTENRNCYTTLQIRGGEMLSVLNCASNRRLTQLDIRHLTALQELNSSNCGLETLRLGKNAQLRELRCFGNPALTELELGGLPGLQLLIGDECGLTALDLRANEQLRRLSCTRNKLKRLDLSRNTQLSGLECSHNPLTTLDLGANPRLGLLMCNECNLTKLDLRANPRLRYLTCSGNALTELDLSRNAVLGTLVCSDNALTRLDFHREAKLYMLWCQNNRLTVLDVGGLPLMLLECQNNRLTELSVQGCNKLSSLNLDRNPLSNSALNRIYEELPDRSAANESGVVWVAPKSPGNRSIAEAKNWTVLEWTPEREKLWLQEREENESRYGDWPSIP
ncbi:MAG: hypothetical protein K2G93_06615 [Rikenella sp.]|nr:hypothetical protein [Rikenella sp.]